MCLDRPAITIVDNAVLEFIMIPPNVDTPSYGVPILIRESPKLSKNILDRIQQNCPNCVMIVVEGRPGFNAKSEAKSEQVRRLKK